MNISNFEIDTSTMSDLATVRKFTVTGDIGSEFEIIALEVGTLKYYNFISKTFELGHSASSNLKIKLTTTRFSSSISFASGGGDFEIKIRAINGTTIFNDKKQYIVTKSLSKISSATTLTFQGASLSNSNNYETFPTTTISGNFKGFSSSSYDWSIQNKINNTHGFGLVPISSTELNIDDKPSVITEVNHCWFFQTTDTVNGAITSSSEVVVDSVTDLIAGMKIVAVSSGSLSGQPFILSIDIDTKTLTLSSAQTFADGITLTFKAEGIDLVNRVLDCEINFSNINVTPTLLVKTLRTDISNSANLALNNTVGIAGGGSIVSISGVGVNNEGTNFVNEITTPDADGSGGNGVINVDLNQNLAQGVVLTFIGSFAVINFAGEIIVNSFPSANRTINFDIDKFLSVGLDS